MAKIAYTDLIKLDFPKLCVKEFTSIFAVFFIEIDQGKC
jgi:hypothetical protein